MHGFGFFSRIDELKDKSKDLMNEEMISSDNELTDNQEAELDNVAVIKLDTGDYKASGSAGNMPNEMDDTIEPQLGGMGLGTSCGIKKEMARNEGFEGNEVVDEKASDTAKEVADNNKIEKLTPETQAMEMFGEMFGKSFGADENTHDASKPHVDIEIDGFKVKKGW